MESSVYWPNTWAGWWVAGDGKAVLIEHRKGGIFITVAPNRYSHAYGSAEYMENGKLKVERIEATALLDDAGRRHLRIQGRSSRIGPKYRLYSTIHDPQGVLIPALDETPVTELVLAPDTSMGLYDTKGDDLGLPWAYPLRPLLWVGLA